MKNLNPGNNRQTRLSALLSRMATALLLNIFIFPLFYATYAFCGEKPAINPVPDDKPRLVVGIVVEKMRYDYLTRMWDRFGENGFRRLVNEGTLCRNASFEYLHNQTSPGYATIFTGANPSEHGIISNRWYRRLQGTIQESDHDESSGAVGGTYLNGKRSPVNLMSETVGDILRKASDFRSRVYTVSMNPAGAVLSGGFSANAAWWFDSNSGQWMTSTYYIESLPGWVEEFNEKRLPERYLDRVWKPLPAYGEYFSLNSKKTDSGSLPFEHDLRSMRRRGDDYSLLKYTPFGDTYTRDFSISLILNENLGKGRDADMIVIGFSGVAEIGGKHGVFSPELQDAYLRLDSEIAHFLEFIDKNFGRENVLLFLTSDQGAAYPDDYVSASRIPTGTFSQGAAMGLLRSYLNATYGEGEWVLGYHSRQVYLNRLLIEDSNIPLAEIQTKAASFLDQVSGVSGTFTSQMLTGNYYSSGPGSAVQKGFNPKRSGDIIISLRPGWKERSVTEDNTAQPVSDSHVPLIWYGGRINPGVVERPVGITDIAPTISFMLNIPFTNRFSGQPIKEITR